MPPEEHAQQRARHNGSQNVADVRPEPVHGYGESPPVGETLRQGRSGRKVPEGTRYGHEEYGEEQDGKIGGSANEGVGNGGAYHAAGKDQAPLAFQQVYYRAAAKVDHAGPSLPDAQQAGYLGVAEPQRGGYRRHKYGESLVVQVGYPVPDGDAPQNKAPVLSKVYRGLGGRFQQLLLHACRVPPPILSSRRDSGK